MQLDERMLRLNHRKAAGLETWMRRPENFRDFTTKPKWHIFENFEITRDSRDIPSVKWTGKCGYTVVRNYALTDGQVAFRDFIKTPKLRCSKCEKKAGRS